MTMLAMTLYGEGQGVPLLIVHGLFGAGRNWRALAKYFSRTRPVVVVDMRNHGASFWDENHDYFDMADDLARVIEAHGGQMDVLGHSMGGKAAMVLAVKHPEAIRRLIVADIAPVGYSHTQMDSIEAMRAVQLGQISRRSEVDAAMADKIKEPAVRAFLSSSLKLDAAGNSWQLNLDALATNMVALVGFPDLTGTFNGPAHFVYGGLSVYVKPDHHGIIANLFPQADYHEIAGAGHWLHAEKPREFMEVVDGLLGRDNL